MKNTAAPSARSELYLRNRQRTRPIDLKVFRSITKRLIARTGPTAFRVGVLLVGEAEMTRLNEAYLRHAGSTDVIAFGYTAADARSLHGEVFICVDEALRQARRYHTSWQEEVVRYLAHGLLHLQGYDDSTTPARRRMKLVENALVRETARHFCLSRLAGEPKIRA
jgi:probable rRNA maturation factor